MLIIISMSCTVIRSICAFPKAGIHYTIVKKLFIRSDVIRTYVTLI